MSSVSQISWSYCSFSAFISELMLYFILRVLSIRSDPFQELSNLPGFVTPLHHAPGIRHHLETKSTSVQRKSGWPTLDGWVVESLKRNLFACRRCICNSSNLVIGSWEYNIISVAYIELNRLEIKWRKLEIFQSGREYFAIQLYREKNIALDSLKSKIN